MPAFVDIPLSAGFTISVSSCIDWIGQYTMNRIISRFAPENLPIGAGVRKGQTFGLKPKPHPANGAQFGKLFEHAAHRSGHGLVGMKEDFAVGVTPNQTHRQTA